MVGMGRVVGIFTAPEEGAPVRSHEAVRAVPGRGLEGDRYFHLAADDPDPSKEITLIASEGLERARAEHGLDLEPGEHRRNIVTEGVELLELIGQEVALGEVRVMPLEDNPPCRQLQEWAGKPLLKPLIRRGGVRGQILTEGTIRVGDEIAPEATGAGDRIA
jgi:MOSC domain-containing protein YiiM